MINQHFPKKGDEREREGEKRDDWNEEREKKERGHGNNGGYRGEKLRWPCHLILQFLQRKKRPPEVREGRGEGMLLLRIGEIMMIIVIITFNVRFISSFVVYCAGVFPERGEEGDRLIVA